MEFKQSNENLCKEGTVSEEGIDLRKIEKVLAPFLQTLKKSKRDKTSVLPAVHDELYLTRTPKDLLILLKNAFTDVIELKTLMNETAELLKVVTKSKSVNLYLTDYDSGDIILCPKYYQRNRRFERRYPIGTYLAAHVAFTKEYVISSDILGDVRFPQGIPDVPVVKSVICLPIITDVEENCIGVIELYRECSDKPYDLVNLQICNALTAWMGIAVQQNSERLKLVKNYEIRKKFYDLTRLYFSGTISFGQTISDFLKLTKATVNADKGALYIFREPVLPDSEDVLIADIYEEGINDFEETLLYKKKTKARFVKNQPGIAGYAARTGEAINLQDAYKDYRFSRKVDSFLYRTRSIVAIPVKNENGVVAVLELKNSLDHPYFRTEDINLIQSFLGYISIICEYFSLDISYDKMKTKSLITDRLLDFYTKPSSEEINMLKLLIQEEQQQQLLSSFFNFEWYTVFEEEEILRHIIYVFTSSDILEPCFEMQNLLDFLFRIKKSYRPVFYHNFKHGFHAFHFTFIIILKNKDIYTAVEIVTMLLAALCHDIDHSGYSNSFLSFTNDPIYALYGDCCGEAHRYELVFFLIQQTNLFSNVSSVTFQTIQKNLKKLILGFDLGIHFQNRRTITDLFNADSFDWENPEHRLLSQNMILICSDYSVYLKNFKVSKKYTDLFYKELYKQGDLEKSMGLSPLPMLNRKSASSYAQSQIILLSVLVHPVIELLIYMFPNLKILEKLYSDIMVQWNEFFQSQGQEMWKINQSIIKERRATRKIRLSSTLSSINTILSNEYKTFKF